jgi:phenylpropionate dioxygenase-like ring-hydroxylating dioxygenase large terminal subunit
MHIVSAMISANKTIGRKKLPLPLEHETESEKAQARKILSCVVDFFNNHTKDCKAMYMYLMTRQTRALDPTIKVSWAASLRIIEHSINKILKKSVNPLYIATFQSYQQCIQSYTKRFFDMYKRMYHVRLILMHENGKRVKLESSVAQLNLIKWLLTYGKACVNIANNEARKRLRV